MLAISNLTYKIGAHTILDECSANITDGWKVGIVGANGAGKSTLFKLITGDLQADSGIVPKPCAAPWRGEAGHSRYRDLFD